MPKKFVKKPVQIEAVQFTGNNFDELQDFFGEDILGVMIYFKPIRIRTLEGEHIASVGDWIIRGVKGEYYSMQARYF